MPQPIPGTAIAVTSLPNVRDLGGWQTVDGRRVRYGVLFRSTDLNRLTPADRARIEALDVATVYDFRSVAERTTDPDVSLDGVREVVLDVLADSPQPMPGNLTKGLSDPAALAAARSVVGDRSVVDLMSDSYAYRVTLPSAHHAYRSFYRGMLGEHSSPALFHCTTGKDRTGWASASFLSLMGVPRTDVRREYLLTMTS